MRGYILAPALIWCLCSTAQFAAADPAYKAEDIVRTFAPALGATRGLCIGTEAECAATAPKTKNVSFDLIVTFDYDSDVLTRPAKENLDEFAKALRHPNLKAAAFVVEGHTDAKGSDAYNMDLSQRRARAVVRYLSQKGVDTSKLSARGYGKQKPRAPDPFDPTNRRVETRLRSE